MVGNCRRARANALMAKAFFPGVSVAALSMAAAMATSVQPPPYTVRGSLTVDVKMANASCKDRSASSNTCVEAPRKTIEQASPDLQPEKRNTLSSPINISSIKSHSPSVTSSG
eukprot:scaffold34678_cov248-Amphora_coffeaeformis.AAC.6